MASGFPIKLRHSSDSCPIPFRHRAEDLDAFDADMRSLSLECRKEDHWGRDCFEFPDESMRIRVVWEKINRASNDTISCCIDKFRISSPKVRLDLAYAVLQKVHTTLRKDIINYQIEREEDRYDLVEKLSAVIGEKVVPYLDRWNLSQEHRLMIGKRIYSVSSSWKQIGYISLFGVDESSQNGFMLEIAEKNPSLFFEYIEKLPLLSRTLQLLKDTSPMFSLWEKIRNLCSQTTPSFETSKDLLSSILSDLHDINKIREIPVSFYVAHQEAISLESIFKKLTPSCSNKELLSLVKIINRHYFLGANHCLYLIFEEATRREGSSEHLELADIKKYFVKRRIKFGREEFSPGPSPQCINLILHKLLTKKRISVYHTGIFHIENVNEEIMKFYKTTDKTAVFITNFSPDCTKHCSPLIVERDGLGLKILNTDSVYTGPVFYSSLIVQKLATLSIPHDLYVFDKSRQKDSFSCPIFSIIDAVEAATLMASSPKGFFDYLSTLTDFKEEEIEGIVVKKVPTLPAGMMKLTQSSVVASMPSDALSFLHKGQETILSQYIDSHSYMAHHFGTSSDPYSRYGKVNLAAAKKSAKYFEQFFEEIISSPT
jgi:hypothetical protein